MKSLLPLLLVGLATALPPNFSVLKRQARLGLNRALVKTEENRVKTTEEAFLEHTRLVTIPFLKTKITDMHNSMKLCLTDHMNEDTKDNRIEFESMVESCVGHDYSIMLRFYQEINQYIKEVTKNDLKCVLSAGYCKRRISECLEYLQVINDFIEMDFDMGASIQMTRKSLGRRFGRHFYDRLINLTEDQLEQYNLINQLLKSEKEFMEQFLANQYREWKARHGVAVVSDVDEEGDSEGGEEEGESQDDYEDDMGEEGEDEAGEDEAQDTAAEHDEPAEEGVSAEDTPI